MTPNGLLALTSLASLALAALTVVINYLNVRRQAEAAMKAEQVKWLRDKRDDLYGRILLVTNVERWRPPPVDNDDPRYSELQEISFLTMRYASDAVLSASEELIVGIQSRRDPITPEFVEASARVARQIREEIAGQDEAAKTWRRWNISGSRTALR